MGGILLVRQTIGLWLPWSWFTAIFDVVQQRVECLMVVNVPHGISDGSRKKPDQVSFAKRHCGRDS